MEVFNIIFINTAIVFQPQFKKILCLTSQLASNTWFVQNIHHIFMNNNFVSQSCNGEDWNYDQEIMYIACATN